ncbi:MAG: conjugal transfer protein, partial [Actinobacteria bacterium]|nr:conjugal transfer protein [Actinomycetota bacterium]
MPDYAARRRDPQSLAHGWEVPLLVLIVAVAGFGAAALAGQGIAAAVAGGGWVWPSGEGAAARGVGGLLTGVPGLGLTPGGASRLPAAWVVYVSVAVAEVAMLALAAGAVLFGRRWWLPNDPRRGLASRAQAAEVLGAGRLRRERA